MAVGRVCAVYPANHPVAHELMLHLVEGHVRPLIAAPDSSGSLASQSLLVILSLSCTKYPQVANS